MSASELLPMTPLEERIHFIRGQKVMIDADLAVVYGVTTKRLNEQVKRNLGRFPADFMFQLTKTEKAEVVANCDHLKHLKFSAALPHAFTEHGAIMAASILNSERAIHASVFVVRAFVALRVMLHAQKDLQRKINELENRYDGQFADVFEALHELAEPLKVRRGRRIGFRKPSKAKVLKGLTS